MARIYLNIYVTRTAVKKLPISSKVANLTVGNVLDLSVMHDHRMEQLNSSKNKILHHPKTGLVGYYLVLPFGISIR